MSTQKPKGNEWKEKEWKIIREYIKSHSGIELNRKSEINIPMEK